MLVSSILTISFYKIKRVAHYYDNLYRVLNSTFVRKSCQRETVLLHLPHVDLLSTSMRNVNLTHS